MNEAAPEPRDPSSFLAAAAALDTIDEAVTHRPAPPAPERARDGGQAPVRSRPWPPC